MAKKTLVFCFLLLLLALPLGTAFAASEPRALMGEATPENAIALTIAQVQGLNPKASGLLVTQTRADADHVVAFLGNSDPSKYPLVPLVVALRDPNDGTWLAYAASAGDDVAYNVALAGLPDLILDPANRAYYAVPQTNAAPSAAATGNSQPQVGALAAIEPSALSGHKLPWQAGITAVVTQKDGTYHNRQIDFVVANDKVYASKPGTVIYVKESAPDPAGPQCLNDGVTWKKWNYVVVKHSDTDYSWYGHFKYNSVAVSVGQSIGFGTFLGTQGRTGYTCGNTGIHLHYMGVNAMPPLNWFPDPSLPDESTWPYADSITTVNFSEIPWASIVVGQTLTSQNTDRSATVTTLPAGATACAADGEICNFDGIGTVYYGKDGAYRSLAGVVMSTPCGLGAFTDPAPGETKSCFVLLTGNAPTCPVVTGSVKLYTGTACQGTKFSTVVGLNQLDLGTFNNLTQSMALPLGWSARVYKNSAIVADESICVTATDPNLNDDVYPAGGNVGNSITWVKIYQNNSCAGDLPPAAFGKVGPLDGAFNVPLTPNISWQAATDATTYEYCVDSTDDNDCTGWVSKAATIASKKLVLEPSTTYFWHVRAVNPYGTTYSDADSALFWSFTTAPLPTFGKIGPLDGVTTPTSQPTVTWPAVLGATAYEVCWDMTDDDTCDAWTNVGTATSKGIAGLGGTTTYYWQVRTLYAGYKIEADNGTWWSFTTPAAKPAKPLGVLASDGTYTDKIVVQWQSAAGADVNGYKIYRSTGTTLPSTALAIGLSGNSYDDTTAVVGKTYYYWVKACNALGCNTSNSNSGYIPIPPFIDLAAKSILLTNTNVSTTNPAALTLKVKNSGNAASDPYTLRVYDGSKPVGCDVAGVAEVSMPSLAAGTATEVKITLPFVISGTHNLYLMADTACVISETNETNNTFGPYAVTVK